MESTNLLREFRVFDLEDRLEIKCGCEANRYTIMGFETKICRDNEL